MPSWGCKSAHEYLSYARLELRKYGTVRIKHIEVASAAEGNEVLYKHATL
jgi:hypothetical protein